MGEDGFEAARAGGEEGMDGHDWQSGLVWAAIIAGNGQIAAEGYLKTIRRQLGQYHCHFNPLYNTGFSVSGSLIYEHRFLRPAGALAKTTRAARPALAGARSLCGVAFGDYAATDKSGSG